MMLIACKQEATDSLYYNSLICTLEALEHLQINVNRTVTPTQF